MSIIHLKGVTEHTTVACILGFAFTMLHFLKTLFWFVNRFVDYFLEEVTSASLGMLSIHGYVW